MIRNVTRNNEEVNSVSPLRAQKIIPMPSFWDAETSIAQYYNLYKDFTYKAIFTNYTGKTPDARYTSSFQVKGNLIYRHD